MKKLGFILGCGWGFVWGVIAWIPLLTFCLIAAIAELRWATFTETLEEFI